MSAKKKYRDDSFLDDSFDLVDSVYDEMTDDNFLTSVSESINKDNTEPPDSFAKQDSHDSDNSTDTSIMDQPEQESSPGDSKDTEQSGPVVAEEVQQDSENDVVQPEGEPSSEQPADNTPTVKEGSKKPPKRNKKKAAGSSSVEKPDKKPDKKTEKKPVQDKHKKLKAKTNTLDDIEPIEWRTTYTGQHFLITLEEKEALRIKQFWEPERNMGEHIRAALDLYLADEIRELRRKHGLPL